MYGHLDEERMRPVTDVVLTAYNGKQIPCIGAISLKCRYKDNWEDMEFYVVDVEGPAIVGLPSSEKLGLVTIHIDSLLKENDQDNDTQGKTKLTVEKLQKLYPSQFDTIGNFKEKAKLILKEDAEPFIDHPRKFAIHIKEDLKRELDKMERDGIIRKIQGHTDWCSSLMLPRKKDGSIRVCLDPTKAEHEPQEMPSQNSDVGRNKPGTQQSQSIQQIRCQGRILVGTAGGRLATSHYFQNTLRKILLETSTIWVACLTRHLPSTNGRNTRRP